MVQHDDIPEFLFPKLAEHRGTTPQIKDDLPLVLRPTAEQAPGLGSGYQEALALYRELLAEHIRTLVRSLLFLSGDEDGGRRQRRTLCSVVLLMASDDEPIFTLARAHACPDDAMIVGYMGSSKIFDDAIAEFAVEYADQTH